MIKVAMFDTRNYDKESFDKYVNENVFITYFETKLIAVFSPIPLTPGILSLESPIKAFKSTILFGSTW